jgi:hypothetical protein
LILNPIKEEPKKPAQTLLDIARKTGFSLTYAASLRKLQHCHKEGEEISYEKKP